MAPVVLRSRPITNRDARVALVTVLVAVVGALVFVGVMAAVQGPRFVDHVTLENRTELDLNVGVTNGRPGASVLGLATTLPGRTSRVEDVIDRGETWVFIFTRAGDEVARLRFSRAELESRGWRVVIPATLVSP